MMQKLILLLVTLVFISCSNSSDQDKENDENWINANDIQILFSPQKNIDLIIIGKIQEAKKQISVAIFDLTSETITDSLIIAHKAGVNVRVYNDKNPGPYEKPLLDKLRENGIEVKNASPEFWHENTTNSYFSIMHNKFIVIDDHTIITGSYNFTKNAEENNRENLVIIPNKIITKKYYDQFNVYWNNP